MLRKNHKLKRADFEAVFKNGKPTHSPLFLIRLLKTDSFDETAFSVVVSKKVARLATLRNRNKRKVYSNLKKALQNSKYPYLGVIVLKKDLSKINSEEIVAQLEKALK